MSVSDWVILGAVALAAGVIVFRLLHGKGGAASSGSGCSGNCASCGCCGLGRKNV